MPSPLLSLQAFLRHSLWASLASVFALAIPLSFAADPSAKHPNILMIPVDDLKPLLGCYGDKTIHTPNIDRLAARGTRFLNNACQQAVCGPTRASLLTGLYPDATGVWDLDTPMRSVHPDVLTLPQYLRQQGYETTGVGKTFHAPGCTDNKYDEPSWSIPYASEKVSVDPLTGPFLNGYRKPETLEAVRKGNEAIKGQTFKSHSARSVALTNAAGPKAAPATECMDVPDNAYFDGALAEAGCRLLEKLAANGKPFFLSVGFIKPHLPFVAPKKYWDLYDRSTITLAPFQQHAKDGPKLAYHTFGELRAYSDIQDVGDLTPEQQKELIHGYRACVSYTDAQIGKLLDKLDALGIAGNTIVCLWGDHGWHLGDHNLWCKHTNFENATRAPLILAAPGKPRGNACSGLTGHIDVFPTICDLAGLPVPQHLPGKSLSPLLSDPSRSVREAVLSQFPRSIDGKPVMGYALRDQRYRYVKWLQMNYRQGEREGLLVATELYDYDADPLETINLAAHPEQAQTVARFEKLFKQMNVAQHTGPYLPPESEKILNGMGGVRLNGEGEYCACKTVPAADVRFPEVHQATVLKKPATVSGAAYKRFILIPLEAGKTYRLSFFCRSQAGATFNATFQGGGKPFKRVAFQQVTTGPEWQQVELIGRPEESYAPGNAVLTCHLGASLQTVQFADVRIEER